MGISTRVYTVYGWEVPYSDKFSAWSEEIDYDYPEGIISDGMSGEYVILGVTLFETPDMRWDPPEGFSSYSESEAEDKLTEWILNNQDTYTKFQVMSLELKCKPRFYTFVHYS